MELHLKITTSLLLFVHLAALQQTTTDSPGRGIDKGWLRGNQAFTSTNTTDEEGTSAMDVSSEATANPEDQNIANNASEHLPGQGSTAEESGFPNATAPPTTPVLANTSLMNATEDHGSTATPPTTTVDSTAKNSTRFPGLQSTTVAPQTNATQEPTTKLTNSTESNATTANTPTPELNATSTTVASSTPFPLETTEASPSTATSPAVNTPVTANRTDKDAALGSSSERGFASDPPRSKRFAEWAAVLGTMLAVTIVGLVAFVVLKNRRDKGFSHRKLVEEYPSDPVLRLDNSEPLDLNFGGSAYFNAGHQGDNIQMTNFPGRH